MIDVTESSFAEDVENASSEGLVVAYFTADWCVPCRQLKPRLEQLETETEGLTIARVDVDTNTELAQRFRVMSMPTLLLFKGGEVVAEQIGTTDNGTLRELFTPYL